MRRRKPLIQAARSGFPERKPSNDVVEIVAKAGISARGIAAGDECARIWK